MDHEQCEMELPFLPVKSKDGPYDDESYVAGFEMGSLYHTLEEEGGSEYVRTIQTSNVEQADLIAMKFGYYMTRSESEVIGWTYVKFIRGAESE